MSKAQAPEALARNIFWLVTAGITMQIIVIILINSVF